MCCNGGSIVARDGKSPFITCHIASHANSKSQDLLDFAAADWDKYYGFPEADARIAMEEQLQQGKALLLLDALDETWIGPTPKDAEASYERVFTAVMELAIRYDKDKVPIVVTARKAGYHQRAPLMGFTELEVLDFQLEDMQRFVTSWFELYDPQNRANGDDINTILANNTRIQALAATPLLLSLIVLVYQDNLDLPNNRARLYESCVNTLLSTWDARRYIRRSQFKSEHREPLLEELAWHFHQKGQRYFPKDEVLNVINDFLPTVGLDSEKKKDVLEEIIEVYGLLKEQADGWLGFLHTTLQEYFVAKYASNHQPLETLLAHWSERWWEEVILLYAGLTSDASPLLHKLIEQDNNQEFAEARLILAGRCLVASHTIRETSLRGTIIDQLFQALTTTQDSLIRHSIAEVLVDISVEISSVQANVTERLRKVSTNEQISSDVREEVARALE